MESYRLNPEFKPKGDQAKAIDDLYQRLNDSISGAMMRIGHDHYNSWKDNYAKNENIMREFTIGNRKCMSL